MDYTNLYNFQQSSGIIVPNDKSILLGIQTKFQEIFGTDIDLSAETPVGRLIEAFAVIVKTTLGVTAQTANQFNVNEATGIYLDAIAQIYDLKRIAGTKTRINVRCYFSSGDTRIQGVPAGAMISGSSGSQFVIDEDIPVQGQEVDTGRWYGDGTATATDIGPISAPPGTVNSIQTSVLGWVSVTNIAPTYTGTTVETDAAFRARILASRPIGIGFTTHLVSALNRLEGVNSNCVLENSTNIDKVAKGIVIPAHSIYVGIDCIATADLLQEIASEIARVKPVGTGMVDSANVNAELVQRTVSYGYNDNYSQQISFYRASKTAIRVDVAYSYGNYTGANIESDIIRVVSNYMGTIGVGGIVYASMIANALINELDIGVGTILLQKATPGASPADTSIEMDGYETPYTEGSYITMSVMDNKKTIV